MDNNLQFQNRTSPSIAVKSAMIIWFLVCIAGAGWLTYSNGIRGEYSGEAGRQAVLLACALLYVARFSATLFIFMKRRIPWWEAIWGGGPIGIVLFFYLRDGLGIAQPLGITDIAGALLYLWGSYIGTLSEYSRHVWKARSENKGHLYTGGLFRYCRHINYFGDLLLFCGFGLLTTRLWTLFVPLGMFLNFVFFIIPAHDAYLAKKYGDEFNIYARSAKKLVPFFY